MNKNKNKQINGKPTHTNIIANSMRRAHLQDVLLHRLIKIAVNLNKFYGNSSHRVDFKFLGLEKNIVMNFSDFLSNYDEKKEISHVSFSMENGSILEACDVLLNSRRHFRLHMQVIRMC